MGRVTKKNEQLIAQWLKVAKSPIHGKGVFATRDIPKNTYLGEFEGPILKDHEVGEKNGRYVMGLWSDKGEEFSKRIDGQGTLKLLNHADKPNALFEQEGNRTFLYALKKIKAGEEVTFDYGMPL